MIKQIAAGAAVLLAASAVFGQSASFRPPSVPLVANDPFFSLWSNADELTADATRHWTGREQRLTSLVRVGDETFRLMGDAPADIQAAKQTRLTVTPTRSIYEFEAGAAKVTLTFMTPLLPDDLMVASRPITYLTWSATAASGSPDVTVYLDAGTELAVNNAEQKVTTDSGKAGALTFLRVGSVDQPVLGSRGDDHRIDWGHFYLATSGGNAAVLGGRVARDAFAGGRPMPAAKVANGVAANASPVLAVTFPLGKLGTEAKSARAILAYDDDYSIRYFNTDLKGYWTKDGAKIEALLQTADKEYDALAKRCATFDDELIADLKKIGGESYVNLGVLAYRQSLAAQKIVADANGQPLSFSKENNSNGCMSTVDVLYPASPLMMAFSPNLLKASLVPVLDYSSSPRWKHDNAPHDLGTFPIAMGQVYGGGDGDGGMPVEETGNMLAMLAGLAKAEGNAEFSRKYWPLLTTWANYLKEKGLDPENQLTTDDFAGHIARNTNLSAKAIMGIACYARLADMLGKSEDAAKYQATAKDYAQKWMKMADDGDHYALVFGDKGKGTWSQKYNLVWDRLLGLNVFPKDVAQKEIAFYRTKMNEFGLPLDSRKSYTKIDWELWTASMADKDDDFRAIVDASAKYAQETSDRVPLSDWYETKNARKSGFRARSVVGGLFIAFLRDEATWQKYASRDKTKLGDWAANDFTKPKVKPIVAAADTEPSTWRYTTSAPSDQWFAAGFDDSTWKTGKSGFGVHGTPGEKLNTEWRTNEIYLRREFTLPEGADLKNAMLYVHHDDNAVVYLNGIVAARLGGFTAEYVTMKMSDEARQSLKPGKNVFAIACKQDGGGQYIDAGIVELVSNAKK